MNQEPSQRPATAAHWNSCDRLSDGDTVPVILPPRRGTMWRLLALIPGLLVIGTVIAWSIL